MSFKYEYKAAVDKLSLDDTLYCGQCFRFKKLENGSHIGVIDGVLTELRYQGGVLTARHSGDESFNNKIKEFFALDVDYQTIKAILSRNETLKTAISYAPGIRVLKQPLFETVISFIISQNNNIPRITGIIERLCQNFGAHDGLCYSFPDAKTLSSLSREDLSPLRCGFRDKYIIDAAKKFADGSVDEQAILSAPLNEARSILMTINGVGPKVADCSLLFGAARYDAFPADVWIKRAMAELFPNGLPEYALPYAGIAQQYIFHYARTSGIFEKEKTPKS